MGYSGTVRGSLRARPDLLAAAASLLLAVVLLAECVFGGRALFERDVALLWYPGVASLLRILAGGEAPLWDPYVGFGRPFLANPGAQLLYPAPYLSVLIHPGLAYTVSVVLHLAFATFGMYHLARRLDLAPHAAAAAAGAWALSGPVVSSLNLLAQFSGTAWMPWVVLAGERAAVSRRVRDGVLWGAAAAGQVLAGSPDMSTATLLTSIAFTARHLARRRPRAEGLALARTCGVAALLAVSLSAAQWMPTADVARRSLRTAFGGQAFWSVPPVVLAQLAVPVWTDGLPLTPRAVTALAEWSKPFFASLYLGAPVMALAVAGLAAPRRLRWLLLALFAVAALFALGRHSPVHGLVSEVLPFLRLSRYPAKAVVVSAFVIALLAGLGLDAWTDRRSRRLTAVAALLAGLALAVAAVRIAPWLAPWIATAGSEAVVARLGRAAVACGLLAALAAFADRRPVLGHRAAAGAAGVVVLELVLAHRGLNATAPRAFLDWRPPLVDALGPRASTERLYVYEYALSASATEYLGRSDAYVPARPAPPLAEAIAHRTYLVPPIPATWGILGSFDYDFVGLAPLTTVRLNHALRSAESMPALHHKVLRLGAVTRVAALHTRGFEALEPVAEVPSGLPEPIRVYRVPEALPRAFVVGGSRVADGQPAFDAIADPAFDPAREVVLAPHAAARRSVPAAGFEGRVTPRHLGANRLVLEVEASGPAWLVVADTYDPGWRVRVDGATVPLLRANVAFRAVAVPPGRHRVEQVYRPVSLRAGLAVTALGAVVAGLVLAWTRLSPSS